MLKTLAIRQAFFAVDMLLALGVAFVAFVFTTEVFDRDTDRGAGAVSTARQGPDLAKDLKPRAAYQKVVSSGIFGSAGVTKRVEPEEEPEPKKALEETRLNVRLRATAPTVGQPKDPLATASIENTNLKKTHVFHAGEAMTDVSPDYELLEVHRRHVILWNARAKQAELLSMDEESAAQALAAASGPQQASGGGLIISRDEDSFVVNRKALEETLMNEGNQLVAQIRPQIHREQGKIVGYTSSNFEDVALAKELGLRNGDVIEQINGVNLDDPASLNETITRFANASVFRVSVRRDGKPRMLSYRLR